MAYFSVTELRRFIAAGPSEAFWVGLDVHKRSYSVALLRADDCVFTWSAPADAELLVRTFEKFDIEIAGVCHEAGPTGYRLARTLENAAIPVVVAAPNKVPRSVAPGAKTDRLDCIKLARFAAKGLIRSIGVPSPKAEWERSLLRRRHQIADNIRRCKQRIRAQFLYHGIPEPKELRYWPKTSGTILQSLPFPVQRS